MQYKFTYNRAAAPLIVLAFLLVVLPGCGGRDDAETEIRAMLAEAETAATGKDVRRLRAMVSPDYADDDGRDRDAVVNLLRAVVLGRHRLYLHTRVREIQLTGASHARVRMVVAAAGQPVESVERLAGLAPDIARIELDLVRSGGRWQVVTARWERGGLADLL